MRNFSEEHGEEYVVYNTGRYGPQYVFPNWIVCHGSLSLAWALADLLSSRWAGQEGMFLVRGHEDD